jgi:hypothetical protein
MSVWQRRHEGIGGDAQGGDTVQDDDAVLGGG